MTTPGGPREFADLERQAAQVAEIMRLATRLMQALAPVAREMPTLKAAMFTLQDAIGAAELAPPPSAELPPPPPLAAPRLSPPTTRFTPEYVPNATARAPMTAPAPMMEPVEAIQPYPHDAKLDRAASSAASPVIVAAEPEVAPSATVIEPSLGAEESESAPVAVEEMPHDDSTTTTAAPEPAVMDEAEPAAEPAPAPPAHVERESAPSGGKRRTVSVTVMRSEGPLDLVRVHGALDGLEGVTGLALASYTRGRANILLDTERESTDLDVRQALLVAFPEGVSGESTGDNEFVATIGAGATVQS